MDGKYDPANPKAVGKMAAMNQPAAKVEIATSAGLRKANMPAKQSTDPAALASRTLSGPNAPRVHWLAHRPTIMAKANVEIILEACFCPYPRSAVKNVTVQFQTENSVPT
jgi:hypothetical protein